MTSLTVGFDIQPAQKYIYLLESRYCLYSSFSFLIYNLHQNYIIFSVKLGLELRYCLYSSFSFILCMLQFK